MTAAVGTAASQATALGVTAGTTVPAVGQAVALGVVGNFNRARPKTSQMFVLAVVNPMAAVQTKAAQMAVTSPFALNSPSTTGYSAVPKMSQSVVLVAYGAGTSVDTRNRAWSFVLDGHPFFVLDLGQEGTFLYDISTQQWCEFQTQGHTGWNMKNGTVWDTMNRIVGADNDYPYVWELDPDTTNDESFRDIEHYMTGKIPLHNRTFRSLAALRLQYSRGKALKGSSDVIVYMRFSDDNGVTWSSYFSVTLSPGNDASLEAAWRSLGSFMEPGRIIEISDSGGPLSVEGAEFMLDDFDQE